MLEPKQDRSQESTRRLLEAAAELVVERGCAGATVAAIGERAGYSRGIVRARFGSKENLYWALVQQATEAWFPRLLHPSNNGSGLEQLVDVIVLIGEHYLANPKALWLLQRLIFEAPVANQELQARFITSQRAMERNIADLIRRGIADGSIRTDLDPDLEAGLIVATVRGINYEWFLYPKNIDISLLHEGLARQLERRLKP